MWTDLVTLAKKCQSVPNVSDIHNRLAMNGMLMPTAPFSPPQSVCVLQKVQQWQDQSTDSCTDFVELDL